MGLLNKIRKSLVLTKLRLKYKKQIDIKKIYFNRGLKILLGKDGFLEIGNETFFNNFCSINCLEKISIGDNCLIGEGVKMYDHNHIFNLKNRSIRDCDLKTKPIFIGNNCWIGSNVVILSGTKIGDNCVIGAGVVLKGDVPEGSIVKNANNFTIEKINFINK